MVLALLIRQSGARNSVLQVGQIFFFHLLVSFGIMKAYHKMPFYASRGSEMIGAILAGWEHIVGVELSEEYTNIGRARLHHWSGAIGPMNEGDYG